MTAGLGLALTLGVAPAVALAEPVETPAEATAGQTPEATNVAKIGEKTYATLKEAIKDVKDHETIELTADVPNAEGISVPSGKNFVIDFGGHTYTLSGPGAGSAGTETQGFQLLKDSNIVFKNGTINIAPNADNIKRIINSYCDVTFENMTFDATHQVGGQDYALSFNNGEAVFKGNTNIVMSEPNAIAFDVCHGWASAYPNVSVSFDGDFYGDIQGSIVYDTNSLENAEINVLGNGSFKSIVLSDQTKKTIASSSNAEPTIVVSGGTFEEQPQKDWLAESVTAVKNETGEWTISKAPEAIASVGNQSYATLEKAVAEASNGDTVTLLADATCVSRITIDNGKSIEVDLAGHDVTFDYDSYFYVKHGKLEIKGDGTVAEGHPYYGPIMIEGAKTNVADYSVVTIGKNVTLEGWSGIFVDYNEDKVAYGVVVTLNGHINSVEDTSGAGGHGIYLQGTIKPTEGYVPKFTLGETATITSVGNGIYAAGYGEWIINGASVSGSTGMEIRAGKLTMSAGSIVGTSIPTQVLPNGNGSTTSGAGLAVAQHTTKLPLDVTITGGNVSGYTAFYESTPENNPKLDVINLAIKGGEFVAINGGTNAAYSGTYEDDVKNGAGFISGGSFSSSVKNYVVDSLNAELHSSDGMYSYYETVEQALAAAKPGDVVKDLSAEDAGETTQVKVTLDYAYDSKKHELNLDSKSTLKLPAPTRPGYTFNGWKAPDGTVYDAGAAYTVTADVALTAQWTKNYVPPTPKPEPEGSEVTITEVDGGKIKVDPERAEKGDTVTVTATADEGKLAWSVSVTDEDGKAIEVKPGEKDGTWTFEMPDGPVTVEAEFVCDGGEACPSHSLSDVKVGAWYHDVVDWAVENGIMTGYEGAGKFGPDDALTRAQLASTLYKAAGCPEVSDADLAAIAAYTDVDSTAWYADAIAWAKAEGIMTGYSDCAAFGPDDILTREQLAVVFWRTAGEPAAEGDAPEFPDASDTSDWADSAVDWAVSTGLLQGYSDTGKLDPLGDLTRAQMAAVMYRQAEDAE
ncbi:S-layer homology domain-containing protein [Collinsella tanakaei]|uniref:S-layer homology domain-containing protein n=1 Tax=Collinsella tanakaei TaxID=626935 RepID=UPI00315B37C4